MMRNYILQGPSYRGKSLGLLALAAAFLAGYLLGSSTRTRSFAIWPYTQASRKSGSHAAIRVEGNSTNDSGSSALVLYDEQQQEEEEQALDTPVTRYEKRRLIKKTVDVPECGCTREQYVSADIKNFSSVQPAAKCPTVTSAYRGSKQRVISYCMYDNFEYFGRVPNLAEDAERLYPSSSGWVIRIYHDFNMTDEKLNWTVCDLTCKYGNVDFCDMALLKPPESVYRSPETHMMLWRTMPAFDENVEIFLCRDLDSQLQQREVDAVNEWLGSELPLHVMRDHPWHGALIVGAIWGTRRSKKYEGVVNWKEIEARMLATSRSYYDQEHFDRRRREIDQHAMGASFYQHLCGRHGTKNYNLSERLCVVHDSYLCQMYGDSKPFPTQRSSIAPNFCASYYYSKPIKDKCPEACRPKEHPDWIYC